MARQLLWDSDIEPQSKVFERNIYIRLRRRGRKFRNNAVHSISTR